MQGGSVSERVTDVLVHLDQVWGPALVGVVVGALIGLGVAPATGLPVVVLAAVGAVLLGTLFALAASVVFRQEDP